MKIIEMECYLARYFNWRNNLIVPNVSWGLWYGEHEKDLFIVSECGFVTEVEIKISKSDLIKDKHKRNSMHFDDRIRYLYFAIPDYLLESCQDLIPTLAGILTVTNEGKVKKIRKAIVKSKYKLTDAEKFKVARLGTMRIWNLKEKIIKEEANDDKKGNDSNSCSP
jgi:hypothetical protein